MLGQEISTLWYDIKQILWSAVTLIVFIWIVVDLSCWAIQGSSMMSVQTNGFERLSNEKVLEAAHRFEFPEVWIAVWIVKHSESAFVWLWYDSSGES